MADSCAFCGAEAGISRTCADCNARRVTESRAAQGLPPTPPESALRLVAAIRPTREERAS